MPVQSHGGGWRARKKHAGQWFIGPLRQSTQVAEEDSRSLDEASAVSVEAVVPLEEINPRLKKMSVVWQMPCGCHRRKWRESYDN